MADYFITVPTVIEGLALVDLINEARGYPDGQTETYSAVVESDAGIIVQVMEAEINFIPTALWATAVPTAPGDYDTSVTNPVYEDTSGSTNEVSDSYLGSELFGHDDFVISFTEDVPTAIGDGLAEKSPLQYSTYYVGYDHAGYSGAMVVAYYILT